MYWSQSLERATLIHIRILFLAGEGSNAVTLRNLARLEINVFVARLFERPLFICLKVSCLLESKNHDYSCEVELPSSKANQAILLLYSFFITKFLCCGRNLPNHDSASAHDTGTPMLIWQRILRHGRLKQLGKVKTSWLTLAKAGKWLYSYMHPMEFKKFKVWTLPVQKWSSNCHMDSISVTPAMSWNGAHGRWEDYWLSASKL